MDIYTSWESVPNHLKTKTAIKQAGLRRKPNQPVIAQIDTRRGRHGGVYQLYDMRECRPQPTLSDDEKQRRAERLRQAQIDTHCDVCSAYVTKTAKAVQGGLCDRCVKCKARRLRHKHEVRTAARALLQNCVILDTETTGLSDADAVLELTIIDSDGYALFDSLIHPEFPDGHAKTSWADATDVNGITPEMVTNAPRLSNEKDRIIEMIGNKPVVIYNADFDAAFLQRAGIALQHTYCLMKEFAKYRGEWSHSYQEYKWQSLDRACSYMQIERTHRHRALADAQDTRLLLQAIADKEPG